MKIRIKAAIGLCVAVISGSKGALAYVSTHKDSMLRLLSIGEGSKVHRNCHDYHSGFSPALSLNLGGALEALLAKENFPIERENITIREAMEILGEEGFEIRRHLFHRDGTPRITARVLVNGTIPTSLNMRVSSVDKVALHVTKPCDG